MPDSEPAASPSAPPVSFSVDYPDRELDRLSTAFRIILGIPFAIVVSSIGSTTLNTASTGRDLVINGTGLLFLPPLLMILFRQKYPRWWFDWNLQLLRLVNRLAAYLLLLDDHYPATDDEQAVRLDLRYPDARVDLNRWLPLVKWFLAIPHYIVLAFLFVGAVVAAVIAWFAIIFTGRYPRGLFNFVVGVMRWNVRVVAYAGILVTDAYPPFRLRP
ncbi:DUF4389 domain-containing protein [Sinomonas sp. P47F7]|uniref:DUF4389 domain-containing protein n=1 Tax=Sinomonas sp. P47F7 TaxID=3410987 RepID=UPI003BF4C66C